MTNNKNKKRITASILLIILSGMLLSLFAPLTVNATGEAQLTMTEQMVLQFSTSVIKTSSRNDGILDSLQIVLRYQAYPRRGSPSDYPIKQVVINNGSTANFTEKVDITITDDDKVYVGEFVYTVSYNTATSQLIVNGSEVSIGSRILLDASVYPEAFVKAAVVPIGMNPQPFSKVKAVKSSTPGYVEEFNNRVNGEIQQSITLTTDRYGTSVQTDTKLSMYISYWQRQADGTYDKTQERTRIQVIYSAADFINGKDTSDGWGGIQYYRQILDASSHTATQVVENVVVDYTEDLVYSVQNRTGTDYVWGFNGVVGAQSSIINGAYTSTSTWRRLSNNYYRYTRYQLQRGAATMWSATSVGGYGYTYNGVSQTTGWTTDTSRSGYSRTSTGHTYQNRSMVPLWGPIYKTETRPTDDEIALGAKRIANWAIVLNPVHGVVNMMRLDSSTLAAADMLTEADVNARVSAYTTGLANAHLMSDGNVRKSHYDSNISTIRTVMSSTANTTFREGNYWGLYLYMGGHWRAVEVPISWYSINATANRPAQLTHTHTVIPEDPDTDVSLADFGYVQSVFNQVKKNNQQKTLAQIQSQFMTMLRTDTNKAAKKTVLYYDSLITAGQTSSVAYQTISRDFNLNLITK